MLLLRTPHSQHFLRYYEIVYHQGAWYITHNANLVQGTSPGVPFQTTPLLDYSSRATQGTVLPQQRWTPADEVDVRRHVEGADLQLPIYFINRNGSIGFPLPDILRGCDHDLHNANDFASLGGRTTTHIRINWPGYGCWKRQVATRDGTHARNPITSGRFMKYIGIAVDKFLLVRSSAHGSVSTEPRWQIGGHGGITQAEVKVIGAIHISAGSWMPIIQLTRYVY
ncbi:hypothetical protein EDB92DRAFT_1803359 [Lactarius akahatsu]|uniref:Uncharacterized protein n=1 Tax=Lactarius akahatsu TaxID=416441 RepID=A0AAD4LAR5_9AGAM|nr:hypothetical protein EDB92DRAFT_1803359 [Lactarius akahatsu]